MLRPTSSARPCVEMTYGRLGCTLIVGHYVPGELFTVRTLARRLGTITTHASDALSLFLPSDAPYANHRSRMVVSALKLAEIDKRTKRRFAFEGVPS